MKTRQQLPHATLALLLGIISILTSLFFGIPGLIFGIIVLSKVKNLKSFTKQTQSYINDMRI